MKKSLSLIGLLTGLVIGASACDGNSSNSQKTKYFSLVEVKSEPSSTQIEQLVSYDSLVNLVEKNGGSLDINLQTTKVGQKWESPFGYHGFGYAWADEMQGDLDKELLVKLVSSDIHYERASPIIGYHGFGFSWVNQMDGNIGGNKLELNTTDFNKQTESPFGYHGFGYSWAKELSGDLGDDLFVKVKVTSFDKKRESPFGYQGFGYAWMNKAKLTISLK